MMTTIIDLNKHRKKSKKSKDDKTEIVKIPTEFGGFIIRPITPDDGNSEDGLLTIDYDECSRSRGKSNNMNKFFENVDVPETHFLIGNSHSDLKTISFYMLLDPSGEFVIGMKTEQDCWDECAYLIGIESKTVLKKLGWKVVSVSMLI